MSNLDRRAKEIFLDALDRTDDLPAFLDQACAGDAELRQRVDALLKAHQQAGDFLAPSHAEPSHAEQTVIGDSEADDADDFPTPKSPSSMEQAGSTIGPYKLIEQIGEGGMGSVWVAKQSQPIKRKVAIKLIKAGMDSQQVLARFEAERQALAMMDHPNIARVLDGGMTEHGRPYFAMEYVKGVPLTEYCDQARLSLKERLELFLPICNAVQHAHQKGIIHRDLKPTNILICLQQFPSACESVENGVFFGERFVEDSGAKLSWST
ncbi:MAG: serine/threonine-protein kinase [Fuerstiella sp.]